MCGRRRDRRRWQFVHHRRGPALRSEPRLGTVRIVQPSMERKKTMTMTNNNRTAFRGALILTLRAAAGPARAQVCVTPAGGGCQLTIQAGVDVATAGQTIDVAPDTYSEFVEIPAGKDGLVINASGAVLDNPTG